MRSNIYTGFWENKLRMTDFLYVEKEKIVRNSIRNDAPKEMMVFFSYLGKLDKKSPTIMIMLGEWGGWKGGATPFAHPLSLPLFITTALN